jgi:putative tricarboxylic transport membrane protein
VPFRGGGEATAAILGGNVTVGGSGYSEFQPYIESGKMRAIGVTSRRAPEGHRRAHAEGAGHQRRARQLARRLRRAGHHDAQRKALVDMVVKATKTKAWAEALEKNNWTPALMAGKAFEDFVDREFAACARPWSRPAWSEGRV